jgi:hypothetical protein
MDTSTSTDVSVITLRAALEAGLLRIRVHDHMSFPFIVSTRRPPCTLLKRDFRPHLQGPIIRREIGLSLLYVLRPSVFSPIPGGHVCRVHEVFLPEGGDVPLRMWDSFGLAGYLPLQV